MRCDLVEYCTRAAATSACSHVQTIALERTVGQLQLDSLPQPADAVPPRWLLCFRCACLRRHGIPLLASSGLQQLIHARNHAVRRGAGRPLLRSS
jgi:hypothetical protein